VRWSFLALAVVAVFLGPRTLYRVFDMANVVAALIVITRGQALVRSTP